jgi:hypothetical protein
MFRGKIPNISNLIWMRIMAKYLISWMPVRDMGEKASKIIPRLWPRKKMNVSFELQQNW